MNRIALEQHITPARLAQFEQLKLLTDTLVDGFMAGLHPSLFPGSGYEFSQLRSYQPGDPVNRIDWKLFSRSDRYFIREAEKESQFSLSIWLDSSASMSQRGVKAQISKFRYAVWLAACVAKVALLQGDDVALTCVNNAKYFCPSASGEVQLSRIINVLNQLQPEGIFESDDFETLKLIHQPCDLVVIISDFYQNNDELYELLRYTKQSNRKVIVFSLFNALDKAIDNSSEIELIDLETGATRILTQSQARQYTQLAERRQQSINDWCLSQGIAIHWADTQKPLDGMLLSFLNQRISW